MHPEEALTWIRLSRSGLSPMRQRQLLNAFGSPKEIFSASDSAILRLKGFSELHLSKLRQIQSDAQPDRDLWKLEQMGAWLLTINDERYPQLLRYLEDAPVVIYVMGDIKTEDSQAIAVVGTRKPSDYGRRVAYRLGTELAKAKITLISGLAEGIDTSSHKGALEAGGRTIAVLGSGLNVLYPSTNRQLAQRIMRSGAILTEFPLNTRPQPWHFPQRNRIISGMSLATVVVEAPRNSGALITADWAVEQGREVFVVPGCIDQPSFEGNHRLLSEGARIFLGVAEMLEEIGVTLTTAVEHKEEKQIPLPDLTPIEIKVLTSIEKNWKHTDDLIRESELTASDALSALTLLELKGLIERADGNRYRRIER